MHNISTIITGAVLSYIFAVMMYASKSDYSLGWVVGTIFFFILNAVPQFWLTKLVKAGTSNAQQIYYTAIQLLLSIPGCLIYYDAFFVAKDAQNAIVLFIIPLYQLIMIFVATVIHRIYIKFMDKKR